MADRLERMLLPLLLFVFVPCQLVAASAVLVRQSRQAEVISTLLRDYQDVNSLNSRPEKLRSAFCRGFGYTTTQFPNLLNHGTQEEARSQMLGKMAAR